MVNPLEMMDTVGERREVTRDQMEVCLDENGCLRREKTIWLDLYSIVLTRLGGPRSKSYNPKKCLGYSRKSNTGPLGW